MQFHWGERRREREGGKKMTGMTREKTSIESITVGRDDERNFGRRRARGELGTAGKRTDSFRMLAHPRGSPGPV